MSINKLVGIIFGISIFVLCFIGKVQSLQQRQWLTHYRGTDVVPLRVAAESPQAASTKFSVTVPRFYKGEIEHGSYPSPLHTIHVTSILSDEEASKCLQLATDYAQRTKCWDQPDMERHSTYSTCDFPVEDNTELTSYLNELHFDERIWDHMNELFGIAHDDMSYLDFFVAHYQAESSDIASKTMDRLEAHRDGSLVSFTVLLNDPSEFEGGGTFFDALRDVTPDNGESRGENPILHPKGVIRLPRAGDACFHSGKFYHGADVVTSGQRTVLVGFVDVALWAQRPGVLAETCRDLGRMDVANFRNKRQQEKTIYGRKNGWVLNNDRWLNNNPETGEGRSFIRGFVPAFPSVEIRADPEYQRLKKLEAEDRLLRSILLEENEKTNLDIFDGDITIL